MGFLCVEPMPIHTVAPAFRSAAARTVKSANSPAPDGRSLACRSFMHFEVTQQRKAV